ncbi:MAG: twin-arginine translocase TatA/TatE family subunit [Pseudomonadota bacterium]
MYPGVWQILIIALLLVLLFGRGKISELMGDVAKGIKSFKKGIADDDEPAKPADEAQTAKAIDHKPADTVKNTEETTRAG